VNEISISINITDAGMLGSLHAIFSLFIQVKNRILCIKEFLLRQVISSVLIFASVYVIIFKLQPNLEVSSCVVNTVLAILGIRGPVPGKFL
jgi:hypothetical protein